MPRSTDDFIEEMLEREEIDQDTYDEFMQTGRHARTETVQNSL